MAMRWSSSLATMAPPRGGELVPCTVRLSGPSSTATPQAARPRATTARRSLSLTLSSPRPRMTVVPRAQAAATARTGYSSIIEGARAAGTSMPVSALLATCKSPTGSPLSSRSFSIAIRAPISLSVSKSPVRKGLSPTPGKSIAEPPVIRAATRGKAADEGSPGTLTWRAVNSGWPVRRMRRPPPGSSLTSTAAPK